MVTSTKRTQRDYSLAFKLAVVEQVERGELTYQQAQERYGIQGRSTVLVWLRKLGQLDWSQGAATWRPAMPTTPTPLTPEQRIKQLEKQLEEMTLKADFFEAVVEVMERDYGATLSKKPHGKSSKRKR